MSESLIQHVAIIMDGNRRWAKQQGLPVYAGHKRVVEETLEELIERGAELGIPYMTFWAFSTENWGRNQVEVKAIMEAFRWALKNKAKMLQDKGARVKLIGDLTKFPKDIQAEFEQLIEATKNNTRITTVFALNYGGRDEIIRAMHGIVAKIQDTRYKIQDLNTKTFGNFLDTAGMPDPDLIIRTGGEQRLSGFMLWQSEYSELYFTKTLMPEFDKEQLDEAVAEYQQRQRRRGK